MSEPQPHTIDLAPSPAINPSTPASQQIRIVIYPSLYISEFWGTVSWVLRLQGRAIASMMKENRFAVALRNAMRDMSFVPLPLPLFFFPSLFPHTHPHSCNQSSSSLACIFPYISHLADTLQRTRRPRQQLWRPGPKSSRLLLLGLWRYEADHQNWLLIAEVSKCKDIGWKRAPNRSIYLTIHIYKNAHGR